jgi:hypothetical protein
VAVPITGHGQTVTRIRVIEGESYERYVPFSTGIYSNTASGFPGKPIAVGSGNAGSNCGPVTISIAPTKLKRQTTYWIEETVRQVYGYYYLFYWYADPETIRKAYVQYHTYGYSSGCSCSSNYTSPWTKQTKGPYIKLK